MKYELDLEYQNTIDWKPSGLPTDEGSGSLIGYVNGQKAFHVPDYGGRFYAYFIPKNWINFGNSVRLETGGKSVVYKSQEDAKQDCLKHLNEFGVKPIQSARLKY
jgi:hypothetical protein